MGEEKHGIRYGISFEELKRICNWILLLNSSVITTKNKIEWTKIFF